MDFNMIKDTIAAYLKQYKVQLIIGVVAGSLLTSIAYEMMK